MRSTALQALVLSVVLTAACSEFPTQPAQVVVDRDAGDVGEDAQGDAEETPEGVCTGHVSCDDGQFCNGAETCEPDHAMADERGCVPGTPPLLDDGIACTRDGCDETNDRVLHDPSACACLTPGMACDCVGDPRVCPENVPVCHEVVCSAELTCAVAPVRTEQACDDGFACTVNDTCTEAGVCEGTVSDTACADGAYCNGVEVCSPTAPGADAMGCLPGTPVPIDDGLDCTVDSCDEGRDEVLHVGQDCQPCQETADCVLERQIECRRAVCADGVCGTEAVERGTTCNDTIPCTRGDVCSSDGVCAGTPDADACRDSQWCNGIESCQPQDPGRDASGCVAGPAPLMPDGVECTTDVCVECERDDCVPGEEGTFRYEPTDACDCQDAQDCPTTTCNVPLCDPATFTCRTGRAEIGEPCVPDDVCIEGASCDADGQCTGGEDVCQCQQDGDCPAPGPCRVARCVDRECTEILADVGTECVSEDPCVDEAQCDADGDCAGPSVCECLQDSDCVVGVCEDGAACVEGACVPVFAETGAQCGAPEGCVEHQCDGIGGCLALPIDSFCTRGCRQSSCDPDNPQADEEGCLDRSPAPNGSPCEDDCRGGPTGGECWDGECFTVPEGPTGTAECRDNVDNDCDRALDANDTSCLQPHFVELQGTSQLPVGLGVPTTPLMMTARRRDRTPATYQHSNAYCVARHVELDYDFDAGTIDGDGLFTLTPGAVLGDDVVDGVEQGLGTGVRLCNGHGMEVGPIPFPDPNTNLTYMLELEVGQELTYPLQADEHLVVAFRTDESGAGEFHPLVAVTDTGLSLAQGRYQFIFDNVAGMGQLTLRLQSMVQAQDRCAFVTALRIYSMPRIALDGQEPQWREYVQWRYGDTTEPAFQPFDEGLDTEIFATEVQGEVSVEIDVDGAMIGATGLEMKYSGDSFGMVSLPQIVQHPPSYDRSDPLIFDFAAFDDDANYGSHGELWHIASLSQGELLRVMASVVPRDVSWIEHHDDLDDPQIQHHRFMVPLPEDMKVLGSSVMAMWALFRGVRDSDALTDEMHVYWFTRPRAEDKTVRVLRSLDREGGTMPVLVHSARPGFALVRCYWQVPDDPTGSTIESDPHYVLFR